MKKVWDEINNLEKKGGDEDIAKLGDIAVGARVYADTVIESLRKVGGLMAVYELARIRKENTRTEANPLNLIADETLEQICDSCDGGVIDLVRAL